MSHPLLEPGTTVYITARKVPRVARWLDEAMERIVVKTTPKGYKVSRKGGTSVDFRSAEEYHVTTCKHTAAQFCLERVQLFIERENRIFEQAKEAHRAQLDKAHAIADELNVIITTDTGKPDANT